MQIITIPNIILQTVQPDYIYADFATDLCIAVQIKQLITDTPFCAGIAAPQVGIPKRFFVMRYSLTLFKFCFDPKIIGHGKDIVWANEGCLSCPGVRVPVPRWNIIEVEYMNENGKHVTEKLKKMQARIFQHELDHLNGLLIIKQTGE